MYKKLCDHRFQERNKSSSRFQYGFREQIRERY
jgi:hypothetical protein